MAAFAFDYIVIAAFLAVIAVMGLLVNSLAPTLGQTLFGSPLVGELTGFLTVTLPVSLYFAVSEASGAGATWGKRRRGLRVVDAQGRRIGLGRSLLRTGAKFAPWELSHAMIWQLAFAGPEPPPILSAGLIVVWLLIGANVLSVVVDHQRRALYDRIAGTRVITTEHPSVIPLAKHTVPA